MVITLLTLAIAYQTLEAGLAISQFASVTLLFLAAAAAAVVYFAWRMASGPNLSQAASSADTRAGLYDELRSALWFVPRETENGFVRVHLARAAKTVQALDVLRLQSPFPGPTAHAVGPEAEFDVTHSVRGAPS